jgi:hypothetical protein
LVSTSTHRGKPKYIDNTSSETNVARYLA